MPVIDRVLVGESLVIEDGDLDNVAHIDLLMGPRRFLPHNDRPKSRC
jgi:5,6,7,8-tetrahydromethanopterin hydro-lyase